MSNGGIMNIIYKLKRSYWCGVCVSGLIATGIAVLIISVINILSDVLPIDIEALCKMVAMFFITMLFKDMTYKILLIIKGWEGSDDEELSAAVLLLFGFLGLFNALTITVFWLL